MTNRFESREDSVILEHTVEDFGPELKITVKIDQHRETTELGFLFEKPDSIIRSALSNKGWITQESANIVHFKMELIENKNTDGTQDWIFRYYLPPDRQ